MNEHTDVHPVGFQFRVEGEREAIVERDRDFGPGALLVEISDPDRGGVAAQHRPEKAQRLPVEVPALRGTDDDAPLACRAAEDAGDYCGGVAQHLGPPRFKVIDPAPGPFLPLHPDQGDGETRKGDPVRRLHHGSWVEVGAPEDRGVGTAGQVVPGSLEPF